LKNEKLSERTQHTLFDIQALGNRLSEGASILQSFIDSDIPSDKVLWLEFQANRSNTSLFNADLDISHHLEKSLFDRVSTVVLVSATLTTNKSFDFMRQRLGLNQMKNKVIKGFIYEAPFDYQKQALFAIPTDLPIPTHPDFTHAAVEAIWKIVQASRGNAFILFTSYSMLKTCYEKLQDRLRGQRFHPLKQGDTNRQALIAQFKNTDRSVLFGTDSFWEGVDVAGEALRCVVIVKLPFKVPTEPIIQARSEAILANHGDPFFDYSLPNAIVKFKQGFGRLIRHKKDRGCIVCLDQRVLTKGYGSQFLNSLPNCQQLFSPLDQVQKQMEEFYRKTYYLVK
jgi:ATP-dependent DNA helicase DinG